LREKKNFKLHDKEINSIICMAGKEIVTSSGAGTLKVLSFTEVEPYYMIKEDF